MLSPCHPSPNILMDWLRTYFPTATSYNPIYYHISTITHLLSAPSLCITTTHLARRATIFFGENFSPKSDSSRVKSKYLLQLYYHIQPLHIAQYTPYISQNVFHYPDYYLSLVTTSLQHILCSPIFKNNLDRQTIWHSTADHYLLRNPYIYRYPPIFQ